MIITISTDKSEVTVIEPGPLTRIYRLVETSSGGGVVAAEVPFAKPSESYLSVGEFLWAARKGKRYKQQSLADALEISRSHMSMIERDLRKPSLDLLWRWCALCDVTEIPVDIFRRK